jgi:hypothetical protein
MFEKLGKYLESKYTAQPEEPDDNDFVEEFEPDDHTKYPHLYTVSSIRVEAVLREIGKCGNRTYASGMFMTLEVLGLPS